MRSRSFKQRAGSVDSESGSVVVAVGIARSKTLGADRSAQQRVRHFVEDRVRPLKTIDLKREAKVDVALSNAFAFGGLNAVLALRRMS